MSETFQPTGAPWPLRSSDAFTVTSRTVGEDFAIGVWSPKEFVEARGMGASPEAMDVVYVLDGAWALPMAAAICMLQLVDLIRPGFPPLLLVGVDYPVGAPNRRSRDYTPPSSVWPPMDAQLAAKPATKSGGAPEFLRFLEEELDPFIRARYPVSAKPAGLLGDSFGGTFATFAFTQQSKLFDRYWLGSPGLFTTEANQPGKFAETLAAKLVHPTRMFLSFGSLEQNGGVDFYEDMGANFTRLVSALNTRANGDLTWKARVYPDHTHTTILAPALNDALLYLYGPHLPG